MSSVLTIAAGVVLGLLATGCIVVSAFILYQQRNSPAGRKRFLKSVLIILICTGLITIFWQGVNFLRDEYISWDAKQKYARQLADTREWCSSFKARIVENFTKPAPKRSNQLWGGDGFNPSFSLDMKEWNKGTLYNAISLLNRSSINDGGKLASCGYLGTISQEKIEQAKLTKIKNQQEFDAREKRECDEHPLPKPMHCLQYVPTLNERFKR